MKQILSRYFPFFSIATALPYSTEMNSMVWQRIYNQHRNRDLRYKGLYFLLIDRAYKKTLLFALSTFFSADFTVELCHNSHHSLPMFSLHDAGFATLSMCLDLMDSGREASMATLVLLYHLNFPLVILTNCFLFF